jgi:hypothetical protein
MGVADVRIRLVRREDDVLPDDGADSVDLGRPVDARSGQMEVVERGLVADLEVVGPWSDARDRVAAGVLERDRSTGRDRPDEHRLPDGAHGAGQGKHHHAEEAEDDGPHAKAIRL